MLTGEAVWRKSICEIGGLGTAGGLPPQCVDRPQRPAGAEPVGWGPEGLSSRHTERAGLGIVSPVGSEGKI